LIFVVYHAAAVHIMWSFALVSVLIDLPIASNHA